MMRYQCVGENAGEVRSGANHANVTSYRAIILMLCTSSYYILYPSRTFWLMKGLWRFY